MKLNKLKQIFLLTYLIGAMAFKMQAQPVYYPPMVNADSLKLSKEALLKFCGEYLPTSNDPRMMPMQVALYKGILYRNVNGNYIALNAVSSHKFTYDDNSNRSLDFIKDKTGKVLEVLVERIDGSFTLKKSEASDFRHPTPSSKPVAEQIAQLVAKYAEYGLFNGSILVSQGGKVIYKKAIGMANIELKSPNGIDTKYRLASVSKQFTAMLILQLVQQGKLDLNAPISTYLPNYPKVQGQKITLHHLLNHSSGIPNFTDWKTYRNEIMRNPHTPEQLVHRFDTMLLDFEPGQRFSYSNSGYVLLGYIIEQVTGKTYEQCLKDQIFGPLKMTNSGYDHNEQILPKRASGYGMAGKSFVNTAFIDMSVPFSAGALYSTVEDLFRWDQALYTDVILSADLRKKMFTNYFEGKNGNYGYGWGVYSIPSERTNKTLLFSEHSGSINGFNTFICRAQTDRHCIIALSNTSSRGLGEMGHAIAAILYGLPYDSPKKPMAFDLAEIIEKQGIAVGLTKFKEMKRSGNYKIQEGDMNALGYDLLQANKVASAIEIFKLNVEAFPYSGNCYDSLGEAYLKNGDRQLAIDNYKKSIELDPTNEAGKKALEQLLK